MGSTDRTPGQVAYEASSRAGFFGFRWDHYTQQYHDWWEAAAAAVLADADAQRAARGEVVVDRADVEDARGWVHMASGWTSLVDRLDAALAAPTPKETDHA